MNYSTPSIPNQSHILLVENNAADAKLLLALFQIEGYRGKLDWVKDGEEALNYLFHRKEYKDVAMPDLVLLDLNLPKMNGKDVLKALRLNPETHELPVMVMTTSSNASDAAASAELNARSFITKPKSLFEYEKLIRKILLVELKDKTP